MKLDFRNDIYYKVSSEIRDLSGIADEHEAAFGVVHCKALGHKGFGV